MFEEEEKFILTPCTLHKPENPTDSEEPEKEIKCTPPQPLKPSQFFSFVWSDLKMIREKDPACGSYIEAAVFSPGFWSIVLYRIGHSLYYFDVKNILKRNFGFSSKCLLENPQKQRLFSFVSASPNFARNKKRSSISRLERRTSSSNPKKSRHSSNNCGIIGYINFILSWLYEILKFLALFISLFCRLLTGVEIHPGALIGRGFFIDHGTGIVIGQTAIVGDNVTLFQGVTLGGTGKETGKRHPTLGRGVFVGCGAKLLGDIVVGDDTKVGAQSVVVKSVLENCTVVGVPARCVKREKEISDDSDKEEHIHHRREEIPDINGILIQDLYKKKQEMEKELAELKESLKQALFNNNRSNSLKEEVEKQLQSNSSQEDKANVAQAFDFVI